MAGVAALWVVRQLEGVEDGLLSGGEHGALIDVPAGGGEGEQVQAVEFVWDVAPGLVGGVRDHPHQQQRKPAELDVRADAVLAVVEHQPQPEGTIHVPPAAFDLQQPVLGSIPTIPET